MGFVGLASASPLIQQANGAIHAMLKDGELAALARAAQMTYLPPRLPYILDHLTMTDITNSELEQIARALAQRIPPLSLFNGTGDCKS